MENPIPKITTPLSNSKIITSSITIASYNINLVSVILGKEATIDVWFYNENNSFIGRKNILMSGDDYSLWGTDDTYITSFVEKQISLLESIN